MMRRTQPLAAAALAVAFAAAIASTRAATWENTLEDGSQVRVDPSTNRAVVESADGASRPLWDGVHRLEDGSVITIRSGLMVPNEEVMSLRRGDPAPTADRPSRPQSAACDQLVLESCGLKNECSDAEACVLARQLRAMQRADAGAGGDPAWSDGLCQQGLADDQAFATCAAGQQLLEAPCEALVEHLCGTAQRCARSQTCKLALQLLQLEQDASDQQVEAHAAQTRRRCQTLLGEHAFFPPCR